MSDIERVALQDDVKRRENALIHGCSPVSVKRYYFCCRLFAFSVTYYDIQICELGSDMVGTEPEGN